MRKAKITEDKPFRITLRLTQTQYDFIDDLSKVYGVNQSEMIRKLLDSFRCQQKGKEDGNK